MGKGGVWKVRGRFGEGGGRAKRYTPMKRRLEETVVFVGGERKKALPDRGGKID